MRKLTITILILCLWALPVIASNDQACELNGSSQYWEIVDGSQTGLDIAGDFTFEAWIYMNTVPDENGEQMGLIDKFHASTASDRSYLWYIFHNDAYGGMAIAGYIYDGSYASSYYQYTFSASTWYHVAMSVDVDENTGKKYTFYINGSSVGNGTTVSTAATSVNNGGAPFLVGARNGPTLYFDGDMDEVRVWGDIRSDAEITASYDCGTPETTTGLIDIWDFDASDGTSWSGNNSLTNKNTVTFQSGDLPFASDCGGAAVVEEVIIKIPPQLNIW